MTSATTPTRTISIGDDLTVDRIVYGAMRMVGQPGNVGELPDRDRSRTCAMANAVMRRRRTSARCRKDA